MEKEIRKVTCIEKEQEKNAVIELTENYDSVTIRFSLGEFVLETEEDNYFDALIKLREELEPRNIKLLCKGCSRNVYPSGMIPSMGVGIKAYILTYGQQAKMDSLLIFLIPVRWRNMQQ